MVGGGISDNDDDAESSEIAPSEEAVSSAVIEDRGRPTQEKTSSASYSTRSGRSRSPVRGSGSSDGAQPQKPPLPGSNGVPDLSI